MHKSNTGFYAAVAVLLIGASFLYSWKFLVPSHQKKQSEIVKTEKEIEAAKAKLNSLGTTKASLDELGPVVSKMFIAIPEDKDLPNLITEFEALAAKHETVIPGFQISDASAATVAPTTGAAPVSAGNSTLVSFTVNGNFEKLNQFVSSLEKDIRFINLKSLTFSTSEDGKTISLAVQLEVYHRGSNSAMPLVQGGPNGI